MKKKSSPLIAKLIFLRNEISTSDSPYEYFKSNPINFKNFGSKLKFSEEMAHIITPRANNIPTKPKVFFVIKYNRTMNYLNQCRPRRNVDQTLK